MVIDKEKAVTGVYSASGRGYGFVKRGAHLGGDLYIAREDAHGAIDQDIVLAAPERAKARTKRGGDRERGGRRGGDKGNRSGNGWNGETGGGQNGKSCGAVIRIIDDSPRRIVGLLGEAYPRGKYVTPDNIKIDRPVFIGKAGLNGASAGQKVLAEITDRGSKENGFALRGKVLETIGGAGEPGVDMLSIVMGHGFSTEFSDAVKSEAAAIPDAADARRFRGRLDLRAKRLFTIDGEDAKDLDDAVSLEKIWIAGGSGPDETVYKLGVHIADVAGYVKRGSAIDREALRRGTSLYYPGHVVPMLPQKLSNGVCSLLPGEDRLAVTVFMYIGEKGGINSYEIHESVIRSAWRLSYEKVYLMLEKNDAALRAEYRNALGDLESMRELAGILRERRIRRGALDFEIREAAVEIGENGIPVDVRVAETTFADQMIEEFMIACNETVAAHLSGAGLPLIYRTHAEPEKEKIEAFADLSASLGFDYGDPQQILNAAKGTNYEKLLSYILLRSLDKALYTPYNIGHFGLASDSYCHFTAPIRRYPDLVTHRILKASLKNGGLTRADKEYYSASLESICESCSERERAADEAEREIETLKKVQYMARFVGQSFTGVISGVTAFGMYVELENTVEGLVRLSDMHDDYYVFDAKRYTLTGEDFGKVFRLGGAAEVTLMRADAASGQIDFHLKNQFDFAKKRKR